MDISIYPTEDDENLVSFLMNKSFRTKNRSQYGAAIYDEVSRNLTLALTLTLTVTLALITTQNKAFPGTNLTERQRQARGRKVKDRITELQKKNVIKEVNLTLTLTP